MVAVMSLAGYPNKSFGALEPGAETPRADRFRICVASNWIRNLPGLDMMASLRLGSLRGVDVSSHSTTAPDPVRGRFYHLCSKAFIRLENAQDIPPEQRKKFSRLAVAIFTRHAPKDPSARVQPCPKCNQSVRAWGRVMLLCVSICDWGVVDRFWSW